MTDQLSLWNGALGEVKERKLATLTENREPRYKLEEIWDRDPIRRVLQHGLWNFATRSQKITYSPSITPPFGFQYAFQKPDDHVRTVGLCYDEYFEQPNTNYSDEAGYWFTDRDTIYVRYVSDDNAYGRDYSLWPDNFTEYVELYLAGKLNPRLTHSETDQEKLEKKIEKALLKARNTDAMEDSVKFLPESSWAASRRGRRNRRGKRDSLMG